jgi:tRNA-modifying protein YgfZ
MSERSTSSLDAQYEALRAGNGFVELNGWSSISVTGGDRQTFLHNFCTNDIKRLQPGESCEAFFTNVKGKIVGHGLVANRPEEITIVGPPGQSPRLIEHLDRYVIREDVQLRGTTAEQCSILICAENSGAIRPAYNWPLLGSIPCKLAMVDHSSRTAFKDELTNRGFISCSLDAFNVLRIEAGTPLFGVDFDESNLPQEVGRDRQAISFTKGCYLGQETVARIDALGHVNQRLVGVRFAADGVPDAGTELSRGGATAGRVTSAVFSPKLGAPLALAMVRREHQAVGSRLQSDYGECEVIELPHAI